MVALAKLRLGLRGRLAIALAMMMLIALLASAYASYLQARNIAMELEQSKLSVLWQQIERELNVHRNNLLSLREVPSIEAIARAVRNQGVDPESGDDLQAWQQRLEVIFKAFLSNHSQYFQIRYIGKTGDEWVRVDRDERGMVRVVAGNELQNKSAYAYVTETLKLKTGQIYHSPVSLNREYGRIQQPFQPVLRIATPVVDRMGQAFGLVVINLYAEKLFETIHADNNGIDRFVSDEQGQYIKHSDPSRMFAVERGLNYSMRDAEPELFELARSSTQLIRFHAEHSEMDGFQKIFYAPQDKSRYWLLAIHIPDHVAFANISSMLEKMVQINLVMGFVLLLLIYWFISRCVVKPITRLSEATRALQQGDLSVRVDPATASDEFQILYVSLNDYAEQQQLSTESMQMQLAQQSQKLTAVIDHIVDGIITITKSGSIESFNPAATRMFGYSESEVIGQNVKILMPEPYHSEHDGYLHHYVDTGEKKVIGIGREVVGRRKDGSIFPMDLAISEVAINHTRYFVGIVRDISERKRAEEKIKQMAHYDHLTQLPNRALFHDRIAHALSVASRKGELLALLFIDLDGFKAINDTLGHEAGDLLLQAVAGRLQGCVREADTVARLGGDEFAVILSDVNGRDSVAQKAALMIEKVSASYPEIDAQCAIGCSIGIAIYPEDAGSCKKLLNKADAAMYAVKNDGKNHFRFFQHGEGI